MEFSTSTDFEDMATISTLTVHHPSTGSGTVSALAPLTWVVIDSNMMMCDEGRPFVQDFGSDPRIGYIMGREAVRECLDDCRNPAYARSQAANILERHRWGQLVLVDDAAIHSQTATLSSIPSVLGGLGKKFDHGDATFVVLSRSLKAPGLSNNAAMQTQIASSPFRSALAQDSAYMFFANRDRDGSTPVEPDAFIASVSSSPDYGAAASMTRDQALAFYASISGQSTATAETFESALLASISSWT